MNKWKKDVIRSILALVAFFALGLFIGIQASKLPNQQRDMPNEDGIAQESEIKKEELRPVLTFSEWKKEQNFKNNDLIFDDLDQLSVQDIIQRYQESEGVQDGQYAISYLDLKSKERYDHRDKELYTAASTTKVLVAMVYMDLIADQELRMNSDIGYDGRSYQKGNGDITRRAGSQSSFKLDEVLKELIIHSDNTANLMLKFYYRDHYGNYEKRLQKLLGISDEDISSTDLLYNRMNTHYLIRGLEKAIHDDKYKYIVDLMHQAEQPFHLSEYFTTGMAVKFGQLNEYQHDIGIYYLKDDPQYILCIFTDWLTKDQANKFMGGINLQLAVKKQYENYLSSFTKEELENAKEQGDTNETETRENKNKQENSTDDKSSKNQD